MWIWATETWFSSAEKWGFSQGAICINLWHRQTMEFGFSQKNGALTMSQQNADFSKKCWPRKLHPCYVVVNPRCCHVWWPDRHNHDWETHLKNGKQTMKLKFGNATDRYWYNKNTYVSYTVTYIYIYIYIYMNIICISMWKHWHVYRHIYTYTPYAIICKKNANIILYDRIYIYIYIYIYTCIYIYIYWIYITYE